MGLFKPASVEEMKAKRDVKGLFKLFVAKEGQRSQDAGQALVEMGAPVVDPLLELAKSKNVNDKKDEKQAAYSVLKAIGSPAVETLAAELKGKDYDRRLIAVNALGLIGDARAGEQLLDVLNDLSPDNWLIRSLATGFIGKFVGARAQAPLLALLKGGKSTCEMLSQTAGARGALQSLGEIGDEQAIAAVADFTKGSIFNGVISTTIPAETRAAAAEALGKIGHRIQDGPQRTEAVSALVNLLKDANPGLRAYAALALGEIVDNKAAGPLIAALKDEHALVRSSAARGLCAAVDDRKIEPLINALRDPDKDMRKNAAEALGPSRDPRTLEPLIGLLGDAEAEVRGSAAMALGFMGDAKALAPLIKLLADAEAQVRGNAATALGLLHDSQAVSPLIQSLGDSDFHVQCMAAMALDNFPDAAAMEALIASLRNAAFPVRVICATSLGSFTAPRAREALTAALQDEDENVRKAAGEALAKTGQSE